MGASGWCYFVPFQEDVSEVLKSLRWEVFRSGEFLQPDPQRPMLRFECWIEYWVPDEVEFRLWEVPEVLARWKAIYEEAKRKRTAQEKLPAPSSPDEALTQGEDEQTHTIIDITSISPTTNHENSGTLNPRELIELFGTTEPTRASVDAKIDKLMSVRGRGLCTYVVVYEAETPVQICFAGFSGD